MDTKLTAKDVLDLLAAKGGQQTSSHYLNSRLNDYHLTVLSVRDTNALWRHVERIVRVAMTSREVDALGAITSDPIALLTACAVHHADMEDFYAESDDNTLTLESATERGVQLVRAIKALITSAAVSAKYPTDDAFE